MKSLPNEVWDIVAKDVSKSDLLHLCLTNSELLHAFQLHLYRDIEFIWSGDTALQLIPLVRTLCRRRDLALCVKRIAIDSPSVLVLPSFCGWRYQEQSNTCPDDFREMGLVAQNLPVPFNEELCAALQKGSINAFVALMLALVTNVVHVDLRDVFAQEPDQVTNLLRHIAAQSAAPTLPLQKVTHLVYVMGCRFFSEWVTNADQVAPWFYLPSLEDVTMELDSAYDFQWPQEGFTPPFLENLTSLSLSRAKGRCIGQILQHTKRLEHFTWTWMYHGAEEVEPDDEYLDLYEIGEALFHVRDTLKSLTLQGEYNVESELTPHSIGSLRHLAAFSRLTTIQAPPAFFFGFGMSSPDPIWTWLPESIEHIVFTDDFESKAPIEDVAPYILDDLDVWWTDGMHLTPNLSKLTLIWDYFYESWHDENLNRLEILRESCNMDVKLSK